MKVWTTYAYADRGRVSYEGDCPEDTEPGVVLDATRREFERHPDPARLGIRVRWYGNSPGHVDVGDFPREGL